MFSLKAWVIQMGKGSFVFYVEWLDHLGLLEPAEAMAVLQALRAYIDCGALPELTGAAAMAFSFIRSQIDRDMEKWETIRSKRAEAGKLGAQATNERHKAAKAASAESAEQRAANSAVNVNVTGNVNVPSKDGGIEEKTKTNRFIPPTLEQVAEYVQERGSSVDPQAFIDFYAAKGWMVGKSPMKDWKAACRNAEGWDRWKKESQHSAGRGGRLVKDQSGAEVVVFD